MAWSKEEEAKFQVLLQDRAKKWEKTFSQLVLCWQCRAAACGPQVKFVQGYEFCSEECSNKFFSGKAVA